MSSGPVPARAACPEDLRLVAELSHEIRTPLTALLGYVELLLDTSPGERDPVESREMLGIVQSSGLHLLDLVQNVLDWARLEGGASTARQAISPRQLCEQTMAWLQPRVPDSDVVLRFVAHPTTPSLILTEPLRLRQVLLNLLGNAIKFTPRGEVCVELSGLTDDDGQYWLRIDIRDTGLGLTPQQCARLFQPFSPGESGPSAIHAGAGLGLAISQRLCAALGGRIDVHTADSGSTFTVRLPVELLTADAGPAVAAPDDAAVLAPRTPSLAGRRVLLADDSFDTRRLVALVLRRAGAEVCEVEEGRSACARVLASWRPPATGAASIEPPFDVVLLDVHMPFCDGLTAARRLREAGYPGALVALTAAASPDERARCLAAGCNDVAVKPIDRARLIRLVEDWCSVGMAAAFIRGAAQPLPSATFHPPSDADGAPLSKTEHPRRASLDPGESERTVG